MFGASETGCFSFESEDMLVDNPRLPNSTSSSNFALTKSSAFLTENNISDEAKTEPFPLVFVKLMAKCVTFPSVTSVFKSFSNSVLLHGWSNTTLMPVISDPVTL